MKAEQPTWFETYLLDQVQAAVIATDPTGQINHWNEFAEVLYGWSRAEALGRNVADLLVSDGDQDLSNAIMQRIAEGHSWQGELRLRRKDGSSVLVHVSDSPILDAERGVIGVVGISTDITERRQGELRVAAQYAISRILADSTSLEEATGKILRVMCDSLDWEVSALWAMDPAANVLRCVDIARSSDMEGSEFTRITREFTFPSGIGLPGRVWESKKPAWISDVTTDTNFPRAGAAERADLHAALGFPILLQGEVLGVIETFSKHVREPDSDLLQVMAVVGSQIGQFIERKRGEIAVRRSEARKTAVMESALDCVITMDHEGTIVEFNPAAERVFGYSRTDVVGKEMAELIIPPKLRDAHRKGLARYLVTGEGPVVGTRIEITGWRSDGTEFPCELAITRVDLPGSPLFTGYVRDITEQRSAEAERGELLALEQSARSAAEIAQERLSFLAEASDVLSESLVYRETLGKVARLTVPRLADWCILYTVEESGRTLWVQARHETPAKDALLQELSREHQEAFDRLIPVAEVLRTGHPHLLSPVPEELFESVLTSVTEPTTLTALAPHALMVVPLRARGRTFGAIALASSKLDHTYDHADLALADDFARRAAQAIDNARLYQERSHVARSLQRSLLPPELPTVPGFEIAARYRAAGEGNEVGGDFYDLFETGGGHWAAVIGDVCGKGPDAAALTGLVRHTVRAAAMGERKPDEILGLTNAAILRQVSDARFCTVACGLLQRNEAGTHCLTLSCGGHPPPMVLRAGGAVEKLDCIGTLLGVITDPELQNVDVELRPGDAVILYTDGITEARGHGDVFGEEGLEELLRSSAGLDAGALADKLETTVVDYQNQSPRDDIAILVVRVPV